jgi:DNA-directed RNA polymerase subunit alpha
MLAYDMAASSTGITIRGVSHEYQVVDGMKESVVEVMLHIKKLRFLMDDLEDREVTISQTFNGVGLYTSSDLKLPAGVVLLNTDVTLFEITDPSLKFIIDIRVEKGYGYYSIEFLRSRQKNKDESDIDMILIDNDFRVIDSVVYDVEEVIDDVSGSVKDKLILTIKSQFASYSPQKFMAFA